MATRANVIADINTDCIVVGATGIESVKIVDTLQLDNGNTLETQEVPVAVLDDMGALVKRTQLIMVEYSIDDQVVGTDAETGNDIVESVKTEVQAFRGKIEKNHTPSTAEADLLAKFNDIESTVGTQVKINPSSLDTLGIAYFVFEVGGIRNVTATLAGTQITREAI